MIFNDIKQGDRVRWSNTDQRGTVRTVGQATILVEWEDGRVRGCMTCSGTTYTGSTCRRLGS